MYGERLLEQYDRNAGAILSGFNEAMATSSPESFHRLRVGAKRMRALFSVTESIDPAFPARRWHRRLRPLFRAAGFVRDLQVQIDLTSRIAEANSIDVDVYRISLEASARGATDEFVTTTGSFDLERLDRAREAVSSSLATIPEPVAGSLASARVLASVRKVIAWGSEEHHHDLHELRTVSKQAYFAWDLVDAVFPGCLEESESKKRLHETQQLLGKWHDLEVALQFSGALPEETSEYGDLASFRRIASEEKDALAARAEESRAAVRLPARGSGCA